jgi:hypothetical protein
MAIRGIGIEDKDGDRDSTVNGARRGSQRPQAGVFAKLAQSSRHRRSKAGLGVAMVRAPP